MRVYKRHGGAFFRASFSFNNTKVSPEGVAKSAYMLKYATPQRLFANILQVAPKIFVGFFCVFLTKGRESERYQIGKKIL